MHLWLELCSGKSSACPVNWLAAVNSEHADTVPVPLRAHLDDLHQKGYIHVINVFLVHPRVKRLRWDW